MWILYIGKYWLIKGRKIILQKNDGMKARSEIKKDCWNSMLKMLWKIIKMMQTYCKNLGNRHNNWRWWKEDRNFHICMQNKLPKINHISLKIPNSHSLTISKPSYEPQQINNPNNRNPNPNNPLNWLPKTIHSNCKQY